MENTLVENKSMIVSIEGNIGSGKSTLLANLREKYENSKIIFVNEPVDEWATVVNENGTTMLELFYKDKNRHGFAFQMMAYISRLVLLKKTVQDNPGSIIIMERSLYTDKMVFAKMLFDAGDIESVHYQIYLKWFDSFTKEFPNDKIIYVRTSPEICHCRVTKRSRDGEDNISLEYLDDCHVYHENMIHELCEMTCEVPSICKNHLILDGNNDIYQVEKQMDKWIEEIQQFLSI
jgi:deoxyadenosine/deoxycytidine kinase